MLGVACLMLFIGLTGTIKLFNACIKLNISVSYDKVSNLKKRPSPRGVKVDLAMG